VPNLVHSAKSILISHFRLFYSSLFVLHHPFVTVAEDVQKGCCLFVSIDRRHRNEGRRKTFLPISVHVSLVHAYIARNALNERLPSGTRTGRWSPITGTPRSPNAWHQTPRYCVRRAAYGCTGQEASSDGPNSWSLLSWSQLSATRVVWRKWHKWRFTPTLYLAFLG
jgi:hypothetical protein